MAADPADAGSGPARTCPGHTGVTQAASPGHRPGPGGWWIGSLPLARQLLRARGASTQAGFTAEHIPQHLLRNHPILFSDGPGHDRQRAAVARFFAPRTVSEVHADLIARTARKHVAAVTAAGGCDLAELALHHAVEVTAEIVGLTAAPVPAMSVRLEAFFRQPPLDITRPDLGRTRLQWAQAAYRGLRPLLAFYLADVRPAIRARRRAPRRDVISHLLAAGYSDVEILVECATYGTAGMVTTREFVVMAAWQLLRDPELRRTYVEADPETRLGILAEIMRLEPVVGHLYRRMSEEVELDDARPPAVARPGELVDIDVRAANTDLLTWGADAAELCPHRQVPAGVDATGLAFGDGVHRCPGKPLALAETDALLHRLLRAGMEVVTPPERGYEELTTGYTMRGMKLRTTNGNGTPTAEEPEPVIDFDAGAGRYDLMVALNPGYHRELATAAGALLERLGGSDPAGGLTDPFGGPGLGEGAGDSGTGAGLELLDLGCGSGASTAALLAAAPASARIRGLDASRGMLRQALAKPRLSAVTFAHGVAGNLDLTGCQESVDGILACYLLRNVAPGLRDRAVSEAFTMLRPGGWLVLQDYTVAGDRAAGRRWDLVCRGIIGPLARVLDPQARDLYSYLWRSVRDFDSLSRLTERLAAAGFTDIAWRSGRGWQRGILHTVVARKPGSA